MEGGDLADRVSAAGKFQEHEAAGAIRQILLALSYLHYHGIVHRDLKDQNVLYESRTSQQLKLIDFGLSKIKKQHSKPSFFNDSHNVDGSSSKSSASPSAFRSPKRCMTCKTLCGTSEYMAPEIQDDELRGANGYSYKCDMWSLGVITYHLITGQMPFAEQALDVDEALQRLTNCCGASAVDFLRSLLELDPDQRISAAKALCHPWIVQNFKRRDHDLSRTLLSIQVYNKLPALRRCFLLITSWSLSNDERAKVGDHFIALDAGQQEGTIQAAGVRRSAIFGVLDSYANFLAAMLVDQIFLHEELLRAAFARCDIDNSGCISKEFLRTLTESCSADESDDITQHIEMLCTSAQDGISFDGFVACLRGNDPRQLKLCCSII
jgi:serine/threonine protein kinase